MTDSAPLRISKTYVAPCETVGFASRNEPFVWLSDGSSRDYGDSSLNPQLSRGLSAPTTTPRLLRAYPTRYATISCQADRGWLLFFRNAAPSAHFSRSGRDCPFSVRGETRNRAKPLKTNDAQKRRNESGAKPLKTNNSAK